MTAAIDAAHGAREAARCRITITLRLAARARGNTIADNVPSDT